MAFFSYYLNARYEIDYASYIKEERTWITKKPHRKF